MSVLKKNAFYNSAYQIIRLIFPLITYPYVSRILGPAGLGKVSYAQTLAEYFATFSLLGIPLYAVREISKSRTIPGKLDKNFSDLLALSLILSIAALLIYSLLPYFFPKVAAEPALHWVFAFGIFFNWARIEWFYQGIENYRYITIRNLIIRLASISLIFLVIHEKDHYIRYGAIWALSTLATCFLNFFYSFRFVSFRFKNLELKKHFFNLLPSALLILSNTFYASIDTIMLGLMINDDKYSVGLYNVAGRLIRIALSLVVSINDVITPRLAFVLEEGNHLRFQEIIRKSLGMALYLALPATIGIILISDDLIILFAGARFRPAILSMKILALQLVFMSIGRFFSQILYVGHKEKAILLITFISLALSVSINYLTIPLFRQNGSAFSSTATHILLMFMLFAADRKTILEAINIRPLVRIVLANVPFALFLWFLKGQLAPLPIVLRLGLMVVSGVGVYVCVSRLTRLEPFSILTSWILGRFRKKTPKPPELPS